MKIVLANRLLDRPGGEQLQLLRLARILHDRGHRVTVVTNYRSLADCYPRRQEGLSVLAVHDEARRDEEDRPLTNRERLQRRIRVERLQATDAAAAVDLIPEDTEVVNWHGAAPQSTWLALRRRGVRAPWVWMCNDLPGRIYGIAARLREKEARRHWRLGRDILRDAPLALSEIARAQVPRGPVTVLDETNRWWWRHLLGRDAVRVSWGLDYADYEAAGTDRLPDDPFWVLAAGIVSPFRRFETTVEAVALARREGVDARLRLCGSVSDSVYASELRSLAARLGVAEHVQLCGYLPAAEYRRVRETSHALALTTMGQTWGQITTECAAACVPSIINETATTLELFRHGHSAYVVRSGSGEAMKEAIVTLARDEPMRRRLSHNAQRIAQLLSWDRYAKEMEEVFLRAAAGVY